MVGSLPFFSSVYNRLLVYHTMIVPPHHQVLHYYSRYFSPTLSYFNAIFPSIFDSFEDQSALGKFKLIRPSESQYQIHTIYVGIIILGTLY